VETLREIHELEGMIRLWDVATEGHLLTLKGHQASVESVTFSPDGTLLAASSGDGTIRLWPAATQKELNEIPISSPRHVVRRAAAHSGEGTGVTTSDFASSSFLRTSEQVFPASTVPVKPNPERPSGPSLSTPGPKSWDLHQRCKTRHSR
jgi:WD40 repeat protein